MTTETTMPTAEPDLAGLTDRWHLWPEWSHTQPGLVRALDDTRYVAVVPMLFTWAVITGMRGRRDVYDDRWCYHSLEAAINAATAWDGTGEPNGWHRHPTSGRRRPGGNREAEFVEH